MCARGGGRAFARIGKESTFTLPPTLCARMREGEHLKLLASNNRFRDVCIEVWHKHNLADKLLAHRKTVADLKSMSPARKTQAIYQCDLGSEFMSITPAKQSQANHLGSDSSANSPPGRQGHAIPTRCCEELAH